MEKDWNCFAMPVWAYLKVDLNEKTERLIIALLAWRTEDGDLQYLSSLGFAHDRQKITLIRPEEIK
jgi:hypothetical protein